jgi:hypothetical protein
VRQAKLVDLLGDARFKQAIAEALGRRVAPLPLGRKPHATTSGRLAYSDPDSLIMPDVGLVHTRLTSDPIRADAMRR